MIWFPLAFLQRSWSMLKMKEIQTQMKRISLVHLLSAKENSLWTFKPCCSDLKSSFVKPHSLFSTQWLISHHCNRWDLACVFSLVICTVSKPLWFYLVTKKPIRKNHIETEIILDHCRDNLLKNLKGRIEKVELLCRSKYLL